MVMVVVFEFCVMRCQPLRRALCNSKENDRNLLIIKLFLCFIVF
ncbi:acetyltransferase [Vibrio cincinnatiensis]|nr:acetyltransferase [Vibrio cincinnatiensis]